MGLDPATTAQSVSPLWALLKTGGMLSFIVGGIYLIAHFGRGKSFAPPWPLPKKKQQKKAIEIVETKFLGGKNHLCLINVQSCSLLLGITPQGITCLKELPKETIVNKPFDKHLTR